MLWWEVLGRTDTRLLENANLIVISGGGVICRTSIVTSSVKCFHGASVAHLCKATRWKPSRRIRCSRVKSVIILVVLLNVVESG